MLRRAGPLVLFTALGIWCALAAACLGSDDTHLVGDVPDSQSSEDGSDGTDGAPEAPDAEPPSDGTETTPVVPDVPITAACGEYEVRSILGTEGDPELHVIGIRESRDDHTSDYHPVGDVAVNVLRPGRIVLVLSSWEPTRWTVWAGPTTVLERVILNGYYDQAYYVPAGTVAVDFSGDGGSLGPSGYGAEGDGDTSGLIAAAEEYTGLALTSFHGCFAGTAFRLDGDVPGSAYPEGPSVLNCNIGGGEDPYSREGAGGSVPELYVFGIYQAGRGHRYGYHPRGEAHVHVDKSVPVALMLSAYEPVHWTVTASPGTVISEVLMNGYYSQTGTLPTGVPARYFDYEVRRNELPYGYGEDSGGGATSALIEQTESLTHLPLTSFGGCYDATEFSLVDPR